jgi:hemin uptake protein HemP
MDASRNGTNRAKHTMRPRAKARRFQRVWLDLHMRMNCIRGASLLEARFVIVDPGQTKIMSVSKESRVVESAAGQSGASQPASGADGATSSGAAPRRFNLRDLLGQDRELVLVHGDAEYRLRLTSNDKLILTK